MSTLYDRTSRSGRSVHTGIDRQSVEACIDLGIYVVLDATTRYRYMLRRRIDRAQGRGTVLWVMLNPSTADHTKNDPTIRRCIGFTERWGYSQLLVGNLFAWRAMYPSDLRSRLIDPVGPLNDQWLVAMAELADEVVCAWGAYPLAFARGPEVVQLLAHRPIQRRPLQCLGTTKSGAPCHPLRLPYDRKLQDYSL